MKTKTHGEVARELLELSFFKDMQYINWPSEQFWSQADQQIQSSRIEKFIFNYLEGSEQDSWQFVSCMMRVLERLLLKEK